jgi:uncharacterized membrane protein
MKGVDVSTEILINCPAAAVAKYASDPDNATEWYANIKSVQWKKSKLLKVGSQIAFTAKFLGKSLAYTYEVTEFVPNQKFVMRTSDGPFPMETTYTWEETPEGKTKMTLRNKGIPSGFSKIFAPFMVFAMRKANKKDLRRIKQILEKRF